jgi:hypothetical protein
VFFRLDRSSLRDFYLHAVSKFDDDHGRPLYTHH